MISVLVRIVPKSEHDMFDVVVRVSPMQIRVMRIFLDALVQHDGIETRLGLETPALEAEVSDDLREELQDLDAPVRGQATKKPPMRLLTPETRVTVIRLQNASLVVEADGSVWVTADDGRDEDDFEGDGYVGSVAELAAEAGV